MTQAFTSQPLQVKLLDPRFELLDPFVQPLHLLRWLQIGPRFFRSAQKRDRRHACRRAGVPGLLEVRAGRAADGL